MSALLDDLLQRCSFPDASSVVCAVSGGADSLALLALAAASRREVEAIHVDHGLRPESASEAEVVRAAAGRFGAAFRSVRVRVGPGPNLEARARSARYGVLPRGALTGHTADDHVETVLLHLMRGAGLDGLVGIAPDRRPLLRLRRHETRELCEELGLEVVEDPSNLDPAFARNRVRSEVLPLLDAIAHRDVVDVVARQAEVLREERDLLEELAGRLDVSDARALSAAPRSLARRAVRSWLRLHLDDERHPPDAATVQRVLEVAAGARVATDVGGGWEVRRSRQRLTLCSRPSKVP